MKQKIQRFLALLVLAIVGIGASWAMSAPDRLRVYGANIEDKSGSKTYWNEWNQDKFWSVQKRTISRGVVFDFNLKFNEDGFKFRTGTDIGDQCGGKITIPLNQETAIYYSNNELENLTPPLNQELSVSILFPTNGDQPIVLIRSGYDNWGFDYTPVNPTTLEDIYLIGWKVNDTDWDYNKSNDDLKNNGQGTVSVTEREDGKIYHINANNWTESHWFAFKANTGKYLVNLHNDQEKVK